MEELFARLTRYRLAVCTVFLGFFAAGIYALFNLPIDAFPDLANNQVQVMTDAPAMGALEVEQLVTIPIESIMNGLPASGANSLSLQIWTFRGHRCLQRFSGYVLRPPARFLKDCKRPGRAFLRKQCRN